MNLLANPSPIKSIQRGSYGVTNHAISTINISPVNMDKSFLSVNSQVSTNNTNHYSSFGNAVRLSSSTTLTKTAYGVITGVSGVVYWELIEYV